MARIAGVDLPNKATKIALTYIYGIGRTSAVWYNDTSGAGNKRPDQKGSRFIETSFYG